LLLLLLVSGRQAAGADLGFRAFGPAAAPAVFAIQPSSGHADGGTLFGIVGANFEPGAEVTIGGVTVTDVTVFNSQNIAVVSPALPPGTLNDVTVTNPDAQSGTLSKAFLADFTDIWQTHAYHYYVEEIFRAGITAGCGGGEYCVDDPVRRDQMAVFLLIAKHGSGYQPPPATGAVFFDVPAGAFAASFVEALAAANVTAGCSNGLFCPADSVSREQIAVFLLRTLEGPAYVPPPCIVPTFLDMPCSSSFAPWVEEFVRRSGTIACAPAFFCPYLAISRGEMAVYLAETFGL
jgi:hypothetical protein